MRFCVPWRSGWTTILLHVWPVCSIPRLLASNSRLTIFFITKMFEHSCTIKPFTIEHIRSYSDYTAALGFVSLILNRELDMDWCMPKLKLEAYRGNNCVSISSIYFSYSYINSNDEQTLKLTLIHKRGLKIILTSSLYSSPVRSRF